jgi:hypothetical protein
VEKFGSGLLTPLNIGLMVATGGLGSLAEGAGAAAAEGVLGPEVIAGLRASKWTGEAAEAAVNTLKSQGWKQSAAIEALQGLANPKIASTTAQNLVRSLAPNSAKTVMTAARVASQMANAKFTYDQIAGLAHSVPAVADAIREGDSDKAIELGTEALLGGAMAAMSGYHLRNSVVKEGVFGFHPLDVNEKGEYIKPPEHRVLEEMQLGNFKAQTTADKFLAENDKAYQDKDARMGATFSAEAFNDPEKLQRQIDGLKANTAIPEKPKAELLGMWQDALDVATGKPEYAALADKIVQEKKDYWRGKIKEGRVKEEDPNNPNKGAENYVNEHIYRPDENPENSDFTRRGRKAAHLNERKFDTYYDAAMATDEDGNWLGLMPKNPDIIYNHTKYILDHYRDLGQFKAIKLAHELGVPESGPLAVRDRDIYYTPEGEAVGKVRSNEPSGQETVAGAPGAGHPIASLRPDPAEVAKKLAEEPVSQAKPAEVVYGVSDLPKFDKEWAEYIRDYPDGNYPPEVQDRVTQIEGIVDRITKDYVRSEIERKNQVERDSTLNTVNGEPPSDATAKPATALLEAAIPKIEKFTTEEAKTKGLIPNREPVAGAPSGDKEGDLEEKPSGKPTPLRQSDGTIKDQYGTEYYSLKGYKHGPAAFKSSGTEMKRVAGSVEEEARRIAESKDLDYDELDPTNKAKLRKEAQKYADKVPISELKDSLVHPNYHSAIMRLFEDRSAIQDNPAGALALKISGVAKKSLLSLSPFHWITIGARHLQAGGTLGELFNPPEINAESPRTQQAVRSGTTLGSGEELARYREGVGERTPAILEKTPGAGPAIKWLNDSTDKMFNSWIPRLKMLAWERTMEKLASEKNPLSENHRAYLASQYVNGLFGGVNWKQLGISATNQDILRLAFLAPDFTGSHLLVGKTALEGGGSIVSQGFARIALYNAVAAGVLNALVQKSIGRDTEDALKIAASHPFGVVSPDDKHVYSIRTMPSDTFRALTDPRQFVFNRLNPLTVRTGMEWIQAKNDRGQAVDNQQQVIDLLRNVTPMSIQNAVGVLAPKFVGGKTPSAGEVAGRAAGLSISNNATEAEKTAAKLASGHGPEGPVDPDRIAKHQEVTNLEDAIARGEKTREDLYHAVESGEIAPADAKAIQTALKTAKDVPPQFMQLYLRSNKLPLPQLISVWDAATPTEQRVIAPLLQRKVPQYYKTIRTKLTPSEVLRDPTYKLLRERWPQVPPF